MRLFLSFLTLLVCLTAFPVTAQTVDNQAVDAAPLEEEWGDFIPPGNVKIMQYDGIAYVSGGVGEEEMDVLKSHFNEFSLHVLSTLKAGEFIGAYVLRIEDAQGTPIFAAEGRGPLFMVNVAPGTYTVTEEAYGLSQKQKVTIKPSAHFRELHFLWQGPAQ